MDDKGDEKGQGGGEPQKVHIVQEPKKRRWFQFSLLAAIASVLIIGAFLGLNAIPKTYYLGPIEKSSGTEYQQVFENLDPKSSRNGVIYGRCFEYGWPFSIGTIEENIVVKDGGWDSVPGSRKFYCYMPPIFIVIADIAISIAILALVIYITEKFVRS